MSSPGIEDTDKWVVIPCNPPIFIKIGQVYLDHGD